MNPLIQFKTTISLVRNSIRGLLFIPLVFVCFALLPRAQAVVPAPDGGYPGNNTAEGTNALFSLTTGFNNTAVGANALLKTTTGSYNAGFGSRALENNIQGNFNMAVGTQALFKNTADSNMAVGFRVLFNNTTGNNLTGIGAGALFSNTIGNNNTAIGAAALSANTIGTQNTATGRQALFKNIAGINNTANGYQALFSNTIGSGNTAIGYGALHTSNAAGNTASGSQALFFNTGGIANTASGAGALQNNMIGNFNTAMGESALFNNNGSGNTAIGESALQNSHGTANIALGIAAGFNVATADNVIAIGIAGQDVSNSCYIGQIFGAASSGGTTVLINSDGKLGTNISSRRFKEEIKPMEDASEVLFALKPVTFRYKKGIDPQGIPQFGLVAEEVEEINPDLVVLDGEGKVNTVRYEAINAMLLNEFLKEHHTVQELKSTVAQQQKQIEALTSGLQKVSAQFELNRPAPRTVLNQ